MSVELDVELEVGVELNYKDIEVYGDLMLDVELHE